MRLVSFANGFTEVMWQFMAEMVATRLGEERKLRSIEGKVAPTNGGWFCRTEVSPELDLGSLAWPLNLDEEAGGGVRLVWFRQRDTSERQGELIESGF